ncbi:MAG: hypothetical protein AAB909_02555 [Patescibacteria group bacterium]
MNRFDRLVNTFRIIGAFSLVAACAAPPVDAYGVVDQKCKANDTLTIDGIIVAASIFTLLNDQTLVVGANNSGANLLLYQDDGSITIRPSSNVFPPKFLKDGRIVVEKFNLSPNDLIAIQPSVTDDKTSVELVVAISCEDHTTIPPFIPDELIDN